MIEIISKKVSFIDHSDPTDGKFILEFEGEYKVPESLECIEINGEFYKIKHVVDRFRSVGNPHEYKVEFIRSIYVTNKF